MVEPLPAPDDASARRARRSVALGVGFVSLGVVIALGGGALILRLKAPTASSYLVSPDLPLEPGDQVRLRLGGAECDSEVRALVPGGDLLVRDCTGQTDVAVSRAALTIESYRPGESAAVVGDGVLVRSGETFVRATVVGIEADHRIRVRDVGQIARDRVVPERVAFRVRPRRAR